MMITMSSLLCTLVLVVLVFLVSFHEVSQVCSRNLMFLCLLLSQVVCLHLLHPLFVQGPVLYPCELNDVIFAHCENVFSDLMGKVLVQWTLVFSLEVNNHPHHTGHHLAEHSLSLSLFGLTIWCVSLCVFSYCTFEYP